jgi:hypothetical protein
LKTALNKCNYTPDAEGPLTDLGVLDLSRLFARNDLTEILGDFGAEVIQVEPSAGDALRGWRRNGVPTGKFTRGTKRACAWNCARLRLGNCCFVPSAEEIDRATRMITAYEESLAAGEGACVFEGRMIDVPVVSRARALLAKGSG